MLLTQEEPELGCDGRGGGLYLCRGNRSLLCLHLGCGAPALGVGRQSPHPAAHLFRNKVLFSDKEKSQADTEIPKETKYGGWSFPPFKSESAGNALLRTNI